MRMGMCFITLAALVAAGCSTSGLRQCADLSGTFEQGSCTQLEKKPLIEIRLPDGSLLAGAKRLIVEQHACGTVRIKSEGRADIVLEPDEEGAIHWNSDGSLTGTTKTSASAGITAGFGRTSREWKLERTEGTDGLTYTDSHDERGMALLVMPFHDRMAASCAWMRVTPPVAGSTDSPHAAHR